MNQIEEFCLVWFESTQEWAAVMPDGIVLRRCYGSMGYAHAAALEHLGRGECEFDVTEDTGNFYRFEKCDEHWKAEPAKAGE